MGIWGIREPEEEEFWAKERVKGMKVKEVKGDGLVLVREGSLVDLLGSRATSARVLESY